MSYKNVEQWYKISDKIKELKETLKNRAIDAHEASLDEDKISVELFSKLLNITSEIIAKGDNVIMVLLYFEIGDLTKATYVCKYCLDLNTWKWFEVTLKDIKI